MPAGRETVRQVLQSGAGILRSNGAVNPRLEAEVLLAHILRMGRATLLARLSDAVSPGDLERFETKLDRRSAGYPLQYLTYHQEFMGLDLLVRPGVLIPRQDTEVLVETAIDLSRANGYSLGADVATGSGAIALALAHHVPGLFLLATDISRIALRLARANARRLGLKAMVCTLAGDLLRPLVARGLYRLDLVVSNPPYVPQGDLPGLPVDVGWEPRQALDGGSDGLLYYRPLIQQAVLVIRPGGCLALEIGHDQETAVAALLERYGFTGTTMVRDGGLRPRVVYAFRPGTNRAQTAPKANPGKAC